MKVETAWINVRCFGKYTHGKILLFESHFLLLREQLSWAMPKKRKVNVLKPRREDEKSDESLLSRFFSYLTDHILVCLSCMDPSQQKEKDHASNDFYHLRLKEEAIKLRPWNSDEALYRRRKRVMQTNKSDLLSDDSVSLDHKVEISPDINVPLVRNYRML